MIFVILKKNKKYWLSIEHAYYVALGIPATR